VAERQTSINGNATHLCLLYFLKVSQVVDSETRSQPIPRVKCIITMNVKTWNVRYIRLKELKAHIQKIHQRPST